MSSMNCLNKAVHGNTAGGAGACMLTLWAIFKNNLAKKINKFLNGNSYSLLHVTDALGKIPEEYYDGDAIFVLSDEVLNECYFSTMSIYMCIESV